MKKYYLCKRISLNGMIYLVLIIVALVLVASIGRKIWKRRHDYAVLMEAVHSEKEAYSFLIDRRFQVKETNYYELNKNMADDQPYVLGNVIHCQNGCDSGLCGTGIACKECPIRLVLKNAFKLKRDFNDIVAEMSLYDTDHQVQDTVVNVDGKIVYIDKEPHMLVTLRTATETEDQDLFEMSY